VKLPPGWSYSSETRTTTLKVNSNRMAYAVGDNLGGSRQQTP